MVKTLSLEYIPQLELRHAKGLLDLLDLKKLMLLTMHHGVLIILSTITASTICSQLL